MRRLTWIVLTSTLFLTGCGGEMKPPPGVVEQTDTELTVEEGGDETPEAAKPDDTKPDESPAK